MSITKEDMLIPEWDTKKNSELLVCFRCKRRPHCVSLDGTDDAILAGTQFGNKHLCNHCFDHILQEDSCQVTSSSPRKSGCNSCDWHPKNGVIDNEK